MTSPGARGVSRRDWAIIICGGLVLVASFLPWESATSGGLGAVYTGSASAWNAGFAAWFGSLLCAAVAALVALRHLGHTAGIRGVGPNVAVLAFAVVGVILLALRLLTLPRGGNYGVLASGSYGYGPSFGAFAGVALAVVQAIIALLNVRASGEKLPSLPSLGNAPGGPGTPQSPGQRGRAPGPPPVPAASPPWAAEPTQPVPAVRPVPRAPAAQPYEDQELAGRLSRLDDLRARGLISDNEHAEQRRRIISQL